MLGRLDPSVDVVAMRAAVLAWGDANVPSRADQQSLLLDKRLWRLRVQILAFTGVLLAVMAVVITLMTYILTMEKRHQIAMLKLIGARSRQNHSGDSVVRALDRVSLQIDPGEVIGILGAQRFGHEHAAADRGVAGTVDPGRGVHPRVVGVAAGRRYGWAARFSAPCHRLCVPEGQSHPVSDGGGKRGAGAGNRWRVAARRVGSC